MALVAKVLSAQIFAAMQKAFSDQGDAIAAQQAFADDLANAIDAYIKSGQVTGTATTVVVGSAGPFPVAGTGTGTITGTIV